MQTTTCAHADQIKSVKPKSKTCLECQKTGSDPVRLRLCLTCGHVGCCDSSVGRHARKHFKETGHPIIEAMGTSPGQTPWRFCYLDDAYID